MLKLVLWPFNRLHYSFSFAERISSRNIFGRFMLKTFLFGILFPLEKKLEFKKGLKLILAVEKFLQILSLSFLYIVFFSPIIVTRDVKIYMFFFKQNSISRSRSLYYVWCGFEG